MSWRKYDDYGDYGDDDYDDYEEDEDYGQEEYDQQDQQQVSLSDYLTKSAVVAPRNTSSRAVSKQHVVSSKQPVKSQAKPQPKQHQQTASEKQGSKASKNAPKAQTSSAPGVSATTPTAVVAPPPGLGTSEGMIEASQSTTEAKSSEEAHRRKWKRPKTITRMNLDQVAPPAHLDTTISLVIIGHVDAGKSTMVGHLLHQMGVIDKKVLHKCKQESARIGKGSFAFAWLLDEETEERERGVTVDVAQKAFETAHRRFTLLDAPGHRDFIPNMITGASHADAAVLVVDASPGEFESGFDADGQTREHILLARSLGISQLVVAVNKMDMVEWSQERFDAISERLGDFLKQCGFAPKMITMVPVSGLQGQNLKEPHPISWYKGPTLLGALDTLEVKERDWKKPLRMTISDVFRVPGLSSLHVATRVITGCVHEGDTVVVLPNFEYGTVKQVQIGEEKMKAAFGGESCVLALAGVDENLIRAGNVISHPDEEPPLATRIRCKIVVFETQVPLLNGTQFTLHHQQEDLPARIKTIVSQIDRRTGEVIKKKPRCLTKNMVGIVDLALESPVCIEPYETAKDLGRVTLRQGGRTVAAGIVEKVLKFEKIE
eukprot:m.29349 g.29349  ORF g.29349 m.29349 type:complete len:603 (-) comp10520_c0_seq4:119-1927(-)